MAIVSRITFPGFFHLSEVKFIKRSAVLQTTLAVNSSLRPIERVGRRGVCEGTRGEFHPDPGQSPAEPAGNAKHLLEIRIAANAPTAEAANFLFPLSLLSGSRANSHALTHHTFFDLRPMFPMLKVF